MKLGTFIRQFADEVCPRGLVGGRGNPGVPSGKELLLLELDPLPRRIREDRVETAVSEHLGKFQGPVKERLEVRESASDSREATIDGVTRHVFGKPRRRDGWLVWLQRPKKRSGPKIASLLLPLPGGAGALALVQIFLTMDRARRVVGNFVQSAGLAVEVLQHRVRIPPLKISGPPALLAVPACQLACCRLVVAFEWVEGAHQ